jgi:uncharacterized membrane protein
MDQIVLLTQRVYRLEQEVARLKGATLETLPQAAGPPEAAPPPFAPPRPGTLPAQAPRPIFGDARVESELVATWFGRIGAVALIIGAAFGFKYGIDRGYIGPAARVIIGILAGFGMIGAGEWSRRRGWDPFAQAVTAAGLATIVLSVWAAYNLYAYLSAPVALAFLFAVTLLGVALALRHDSQALAVLATIGAFLDPLLVGGRSNPGGLYGYALVVDAGVVWVAAARRWPSLDVLAAIASWILFGAGANDASTGVALAYSTAIFGVFSVASIVTEDAEIGEVPWRAVLGAVNGVAYLTAGLALLEDRAAQTQGAFAAFAGAAQVLLGAAVQRIRPDRAAERTSSVLAMVFFTIAVGFQWHGIDASLAWAVEAAILAAGATLLGNQFLRVSSLAVLGVSVVSSVFVQWEFGHEYHPQHVLASRESIVFVVQIASALMITWLLASGEKLWEKQAAAIALVGANALAILWLSFEAFAHYRGTSFDVPFDKRQALQFTLSSIWGLYAAALLAIGIAVRSRLVRLMSISLFGLTIVKMATQDLWTLTTGFRTLGFIGLGAVLLLTSLSYHRFRDLILGDTEPPANH